MPVYRLRMQSLGIVLVKGQHIPITLPLNSRLRVFHGDVTGNGWLEAKWDGKHVLIFAPDLRQRGEIEEAMCALSAGF